MEKTLRLLNKSMKKLSHQYNGFATEFVNHQSIDCNKVSKNYFHRIIGKIKTGSRVLDLGCGNGADLQRLSKFKIHPFGIDASEKMISLARQTIPMAILKIATFEKIPFKANFFNNVISKYALQTSKDFDAIYKEVNRVLKKSGTFTFLVDHPIRHFMEKRKKGKDYFKQETVNSPILFAKKIIVKEPSHTFNDYLSPYFLKHFDVIEFKEAMDPTVEKINGDLYPGFVVIKAVKR